MSGPEGRPQSTEASGGPSHTPGPSEVEEALRDLRLFHARGLRTMLDPSLTTPQRAVRMLRLLRAAREAVVPELACRGVERATFDVIFGADREAELLERWLGEAFVRGVA